jgi:mRNA interferase RelE/StbE
MGLNKKGKLAQYKVEWTEVAKKELDKLDKFSRDQVVKFFKKESLLSKPNESGKSLRHSLVGLWRYRIGDYRAIVKIKNDILVILVIEVGKRDKIYKN